MPVNFWRSRGEISLWNFYDFGNVWFILKFTILLHTLPYILPRVLFNPCMLIIACRLFLGWDFWLKIDTPWKLMTVCNSRLCLVLRKANPQNCTNQCSKPVKLIWWLLLTLFNSSVNVRSKADSVPHWAHCANEFSPLCSTLLCCTRVGSTLVTLICWMCPLCVPLSPTRLFSGHTLLHTVGEHSKEGHCDSAVCYMPKVKCS